MSRPSTANDSLGKALPFRPSPKATLGQSLMDIRNYIADSPSIHYERLARNWLNKLRIRLFFKTKFTEKQCTTILSYFGIIDRDCIERDIDGLILDASPYAIDYHRATLFLNALYNEFSTDTDTSKRPGEIILVILIALQSAYRKPRWIYIDEILNLTSKDWDASSKQLKFKNYSLKVTEGLAAIINVFVPVGKKQERKIFKISRSWINEHLKNLNIKLVYDKDNDPVTIQTFLARPENELGRRGKPLLWRLASRIQCYQYYQLFPAPRKIIPPEASRKLSHVTFRYEQYLTKANRIINGFRKRNLPCLSDNHKVFVLKLL